MDKIEITRTCWACKHFSFNFGTTGYSELTPAEGAEVECRKDHFSSLLEGWDPEGMTMRAQPLNLQAVAAECADFEINPDVL